MSEHFLFTEPLRDIVSRRLRVIKKARVEVSREIGKSLSYLCQLESGAVNFSDEMASLYISALQFDEDEAGNFRRQVRFSNAQRKSGNTSDRAKRVAALVSLIGDTIEDSRLSEVERILCKGMPEKWRQSSMRRNRSQIPSGRMTPQRFLSIIELVSKVRDRQFSENEFCKVTEILEEEAATNFGFKITWHQKMPKRFGHVYACVENTSLGVEAHFEEEMYCKAFDGNPFCRRVLAHELSHYVLQHSGTNYLNPTKIGLNYTTGSLDDPIEEFEADVAATLFLVPWRKQLYTRTPRLLANDFRDEAKWTEKVSGLLKVDAVRGVLEAKYGRG